MSTAQRMVLVPQAMLDRLRRNEQKPAESVVGEPVVNAPVIIDEPKNISDKFEFMIALFPKAYRGKAKIILSHLDGYVELDPSNRVIYGENTVGSHLYDLVKYFTAPKSGKTGRPLDAPQFLKLMQDNGVPNGVITQRTEPVEWMAAY